MTYDDGAGIVAMGGRDDGTGVLDEVVGYLALIEVAEEAEQDG